MDKINQPPIYVGSAAVYPYSDALMEQCAKVTNYGDDFSLARVIGAGENKRIWLPRNMANSIPKDMRVRGEYFDFNSNFAPRNTEQSRVIKETTELLKLGESFVAQAPTGFGKTYCAMDVVARVGKKTIVTVTKEDIRDQWIAAAEDVLGLKVGKGIGLIQGNNCVTVGQGIVIAMIQSLAKESRYPEHAFRDFGLAIWDETHRVGADYFSQSCYRIPAKLRLGISATPKRKDGKGVVIEGHIGKTRVVTTQAPMTPKIITRKSPWEIPLKRERTEDGLWVMKQIPHSPARCGHVINLLSRHHGRNQILVDFIFAAYKKGRKILIQSDRVEHLEQLEAMIANRGVPSTSIAYYVGGMTQGTREQAKEKQLIMATYQMTAEATDIPALDTLVMCTPKSDVVQIVGRILRTCDGKQEPVVFDIRDDTSSVFAGYSKARMKWYASIGAKVDTIS